MQNSNSIPFQAQDAGKAHSPCLTWVTEFALPATGIQSRNPCPETQAPVQLTETVWGPTPDQILTVRQSL